MVSCSITFLCIFFFNDPATTEIYTYLHTLSLHDALPISHRVGVDRPAGEGAVQVDHVHPGAAGVAERARLRSEEHTSELQSLMRISYAVFCLKKKNKHKDDYKKQTQTRKNKE